MAPLIPIGEQAAPLAGNHPPTLGGLVSPDGVTHALPLPVDLAWPKNIASKGLGCCSFRSLGYCARWQNVPAFIDLPEQMVKAGIAGGGYPEKVDRIIREFDAQAIYWNDSSRSEAIIAAAILSKRMVCVDYSGHDPHYSGGIAHCVCLIAFDPTANWVAVLDNNYPRLDQVVWMGLDEFRQRWHGWSYGLLATTPGALPATATAAPAAKPDKAEPVAVFGLVRAGPLRLESSIMNGSPSTPEAIVAAMGGEFVPKIEVDHKIGGNIDLKALSDMVLPIVLVIFGLFLLKEMLKGRNS